MKTKKAVTFNPFVLLFSIIVICVIVSYFVESGAYDRIVSDGRSIVVPGTYHLVEKDPVSFFDIFRAVPHGLIAGSSIIFLVLIVGGAIEVFNQTGAIPVGIARLVAVAGKKGGTFVLVLIFSVFAVLGGFLGWIEAAIPFVPLVIPIIIALGFDAMTAVAVVILGTMVGFALGPTNMYTIGIAHQIAELPMFSGFGLRFIAYLCFTVTALCYILFYAYRVRKNPEKSLVKDIDLSDIQLSYEGEKDKGLTLTQLFSLIVLIATFVCVVYGMTEWGWNINDMSAAFLFAGIVAGISGRMGAGNIANAFINGAKGSMGGAMVVGVAQGVGWILNKTGLMDPLIHVLSGHIDGLSPLGSAIGIFIIVILLTGLVASGSGKAVALMPILIPLADLVGLSRQTAIFAYQLGDGIAHPAYFTYGTLLIFLSYAKIPYLRWMKFVLPLLIIFIVLAVIFLKIAVSIDY